MCMSFLRQERMRKDLGVPSDNIFFQCVPQAPTLTFLSIRDKQAYVKERLKEISDFCKFRLRAEVIGNPRSLWDCPDNYFLKITRKSSALQKSEIEV